MLMLLLEELASILYHRQLVRESKQRLEAQRQEYEGAIARHQVILPEF